MPDGQVIEFTRVTKRFNDVTAVSDFSARIEPGVVTAFLGPNGAGKTTTLRILLGQVRPTSGTATIGGVAYADLRTPLRTIGSVLEETSYRPRRTASRQLSIAAKANGIPLSRVDEVLALVGLDAEREGRIGSFSLGMRQRLSVAGALLGDPGTLVFDEPANGLDPEGIRWMRLLMRRLADEGRTVIVSSHVLSEVEQVADHVLVLSKGRLVLSSGIETLADPSSGAVVVDAADREGLRAALTAAGFEFEVLRSGLTVRGTDARTVGAAAASAGVALSTLVQRGPTLEDVFIELVRGGSLESGAAVAASQLLSEGSAPEGEDSAPAPVDDENADAPNVDGDVDAGMQGGPAADEAAADAAGEFGGTAALADLAGASGAASIAADAAGPAADQGLAPEPVPAAPLRADHRFDAPRVDAALPEAETSAPSFDEILFGTSVAGAQQGDEAPQHADGTVGEGDGEAAGDVDGSASTDADSTDAAPTDAAPTDADDAAPGPDEGQPTDADEQPSTEGLDEGTPDAAADSPDEERSDDGTHSGIEVFDSLVADEATNTDAGAEDGEGESPADVDANESTATDDTADGTADGDAHGTDEEGTADSADEDPRSAAVSSMLAAAARAYYEDEPRDYPLSDASDAEAPAEHPSASDDTAVIRTVPLSSHDEQPGDGEPGDDRPDGEGDQHELGDRPDDEPEGDRPDHEGTDDAQRSND